MKTLTDLYNNVATFRNYIPYADSNITFQELNANSSSAYKQICLVLTSSIYDSIADGGETENKSFLLTATANLIMAKQLVFSAMKQRRAGVDVYKYEQEAMRRTYTENYYNAMDSLLENLKNDDDWKSTTHCKQLASLKIENAEKFDTLYSIDCSYLYFYRVIPIQQEVLDDYMSNYYSRTEDGDIIRQLDRILAKMIVAISVQRLDFTELPSTIRNLYDDSTASRNGNNESEQLMKLSNSLMTEAKERLKNVDMLLSSSDATVIDSESSFNTMDDKIILL